MSIRTTASNSTTPPDGFVAVTLTVRGVPPSFSSVMPEMSNVSSPSRPRVLTVSPGGNCNGMTPMPIRFERWIRSNDSMMTARTPSSAVPFAAQSRDEPEPYSLPPSTTNGMPCAA